MRLRAVIFTLCLFSVSSVFAQRFHGVNTASIQATGDERATTLTTKQWVCTFDTQSQVLEMIAKTPGFGITASQEEKAILQNVFLYEANQLIRIQADFSQLALGSSSYEIASASLPARMFFNERMVDLQIQVKNLRFNTESLEMELSLETSLRDFGLSTSTAYSKQFSDQISLMIEPAILKRR